MSKWNELPEISKIIWRDKYRLTRPDGTSDEQTFEDTNKRVVRGVYEKDGGFKGDHARAALEAMNNLEWCPAGRIHAGAGTNRDVTLINCYVMPTIEDSMITEINDNSLGIMDSLKVAALTQRMGGGIGMDFSTLRPKGAIVSKLGAEASGPLSFMDMWNSMCSTIMSAGARRGAMMAVLRCDHPDIEDFITSKHEPGRLTNFNISVLVTDNFMEAVREDESWYLKFNVPKHQDIPTSHVKYKDGTSGYIYKTVSARELWKKIIKSTYDYAEPGVIFIDRVNEQNNLKYCEMISATNPCGEQPLPPNNPCNLGAINLAVMVRDPFSKSAQIDFNQIRYITKIGMRFLDNIIDVSNYPTKEQAREARAKRRTGLGITGLGNLLQQMQVRYGNDKSLELTSKIMKTIRDQAYTTSIDLAKERGPFPLFKASSYLESKFVQSLRLDYLGQIEKHGIRNGVILTIAPTGTTSIYYGNVSSGIEPTFSWSYKRKILQPDGSHKTFLVEDYGYRLYKEFCAKERIAVDFEDLPDYMITTEDLTVTDHLGIQAVCQKYIDASISKTINCPESMTFEDFKEVYQKAYDLGCKGCTTYRPNPEAERVRGSVLSTNTSNSDITSPGGVQQGLEIETTTLVSRPSELQGSTYKVKWPNSDHAFYVTVNDYIGDNGARRPFEIFINTKDARHQEWIAALTRSLSAIFRRGGDIAFVAQELKEVHSSIGGAWVEGKYIPSLVALIGTVIEKHFIKIGIIPTENDEPNKVVKLEKEEPRIRGATCPKCLAPSLIHVEGCNSCLSCGYSDCA